MPKAVAIFQSPSSPGSGAASVDVRTSANPRPNGGTTVIQRSLGTHVSGVGTRAEVATGNGHARQVQSFESWPLELDGDLKRILGSTRRSERDAISVIRASRPDLSECLIWSRIIYLGLTNRKRGPYRKHEWTPDEDEILRNEYGQSRASSHSAIEKILVMHPDWSRDAVVWRARALGLTQERSTSSQPWSSTLDHYLLSLMGCQLDTIARRLKRSKKSVLARLRQLGWSADFFGGFKTKDLVLDLRVTEATVSRWIRLGWLERKKGRITEQSLRWLCRQHPEEIPVETLPRETQNWLRLSLDFGRGEVVHRGGRRKKGADSGPSGQPEKLLVTKASASLSHCSKVG